MRYTHLIETKLFDVYVDLEGHVQVKGEGINVHITADNLFAHPVKLKEGQLALSIGYDTSVVRIADHRPAEHRLDEKET